MDFMKKKPLSLATPAMVSFRILSRIKTPPKPMAKFSPPPGQKMVVALFLLFEQNFRPTHSNRCS